MDLKNKKRFWIWVGSLFAVFLLGMFVFGPWLQNNVIEANQPYILVDPDAKYEAGCGYDYMKYMPVEITGRPPSEGVRFPVTDVAEEYAPYVHYPDSWNNPLNPFNPENKFAQILGLTLRVFLGILCVAFIGYLVVLWRKGKLNKLKDKIG